MTMAALGSPADTRAFIVERLVGDTGEPGQVSAVARAFAERALPSLGDALGTLAGCLVEVELRSVELVRLTQVKPADATGHGMTVVSSATSPDAMTMLIDPAAVALMVSTLFGADPDLGVEPIARDLTSIEAEIAGLVLQEFAQVLNGSGERTLELKLPPPPVMTGVDLKKHILRDGPVAVMTFAVSTPAGSGTVSICMPQRVLLQHRGDGAAQADAGPSGDWGPIISDKVMRSTLALEATVPLARMPLGQLASLRLGQVIEFGETAQSETRLSARGKTLFICEFGKLGQNYTVRVRHPFDAGQDLLDELMP